MLRQISKNIRRRVTKFLTEAFVVCCPLSASAMEDVPINWDGKQLFDVQYYGTEDKVAGLEKFFGSEDFDLKPEEMLTASIKSGLNKAFLWWSEILAPGMILNQPAQYFVGTYSIQNADASSKSNLNNLETRNPNLFAEIFQRGRVVDYFSDAMDALAKKDSGQISQEAYGLIHIGQNLGVDTGDGQYGFGTTNYYAFPVANLAKEIDISNVMFHEVGHSLGISADRRDNPYGEDFSYNGNEILIIGDGADNPYDYTSHLRNSLGEAPKNGAYILTSAMFNDENLRSKYLELTGKELTAEDVFIVEDINWETGRNGRVGLYFVGDNVLEVFYFSLQLCVKPPVCR